ncbi:nucleoside hydrolase [Terrabacter carboxydivorans]|uniref:Pyrimidine-specific ribonucleoside hydrolase RihA n=1 Tax=Terrabacter carboxydivorans TaxID=619730 RepID=A0ABP5ZX69_9MICO
MGARPIVVDCDPGHDDAVALLLAVGSDEVDLQAVTTTFGNCSVDDATRNAVQILTLAGATGVPVAQGAAGGLDGVSTLGNYVHGASGLDGPAMPEPGFEVVAEGAVELLRRVIESSDEPVTIAATGPITNVAQLLLDHPEVSDGVREVIFMGGSTERGNHTPTAEFNTYADPEALDVVLRSGLPVRMVGLNLTHQALATPEVVTRMAAMEHTVGRTCAAWMGFFGASYNRVWEFAAPPVHDPCTIAALIDSDVIEWREAFVAVELQGTWTRGTTVVDLHHRYPDERPNAQVAMTLDAARYWDLVIEAVDRVGRST